MSLVIDFVNKRKIKSNKVKQPSAASNTVPKLSVLDATQAFSQLYKSLETYDTKFIVFYAMGKYRKPIPPLCAMYEELQRIMIEGKSDHFSNNLVSIAALLKYDIIRALEKDIIKIIEFIGLYLSVATSSQIKILAKMLRKYELYLLFFEQFGR